MKRKSDEIRLEIFVVEIKPKRETFHNNNNLIKILFRIPV